jgi:DNA-binding transcriptional ArsR family regulator
MTALLEISYDKMQASVDQASTLLKSMANENRLLILCQLVEGEKSVTALQGRLPLSQSALSQHLAVLRRDGLVKTRRAAQSIYYSLASPEAEAVLSTLYDLYCE